MLRTHALRLTAAAGLIAAAAALLAQEAGRSPRLDILKRPEVVRGQQLFQQNCAACHGANATGGVGPNLIASSLVRHDVKGDQIGVVVHNGRLEKGMPAFPNLTQDQIGDIAAFVHARIEAFTRASALGGSVFGGNLAVGDAAAGKVFFQSHCASCHDPAGNFAGIAKKYDPSDLEGRMLAPKEPPPTGSVTVANGKTVRGTFLHRDEFFVTLRDASGNTQTFDTGRNVTVTVDHPLQAHRDLLKTYTNKDIHDVFAYLETLK